MNSSKSCSPVTVREPASVYHARHMRWERPRTVRSPVAHRQIRLFSIKLRQDRLCRLRLCDVPYELGDARKRGHRLQVHRNDLGLLSIPRSGTNQHQRRVDLSRSSRLRTRDVARVLDSNSPAQRTSRPLFGRQVQRVRNVRRAGSICRPTGPGSLPTCRGGRRCRVCLRV